MFKLKKVIEEVDKMLGVTNSIKVNRAKLNIQYIKDKAKLITRYNRIKKKNDDIIKYNSDAEWLFNVAKSSIQFKQYRTSKQMDDNQRAYDGALSQAKTVRDKLKVIIRFKGKKLNPNYPRLIIVNGKSVQTYINIELEVLKHLKKRRVSKNTYPQKILSGIDTKQIGRAHV